MDLWYWSPLCLCLVITRDSKVIMFSTCVFVCLCVCVYVCHDVYPDDLTMKDWCHTNNILQVHCWGCLVVQVMFHALMTSLMTSQGHKVGQIFKLLYLRQYLGYSVDQKLKMSEMLMAIFLVYSTSGTTSGKKFVAAQNGGHFKNFEILNTASILPQIWKDRPKLCQKCFFHCANVIDDVTGWHQSYPLYSCFGVVGSGKKLHGQCLVNKCKYHNCLSRLYMPKDDLNE